MNDTKLQQITSLMDETKARAKRALAKALLEYNAIDLADDLGDLSLQDRVRLFDALSPNIAAEVLDETDSETREQLMLVLPNARIAEIVQAMPPDEGADIIQQLPGERGHRVLSSLDKEAAAVLQRLIEHHPETAGGMMTTDYIWAEETESAAQALRRVSQKRTEHAGEIFVLDAGGHLKGIVPIQNLLEQPAEQQLYHFMRQDPKRVGLATDQEAVANLVHRYNLPSLPVVDDRDVLQGIITLDDVLDVVENEVDEDMFRIAGAMSRDLDRTPIRKKYLKRFPFLLTTFFGGIMTILIQYTFRFSTEQLVAITFFIPIINGLSGNVGLQSSTIVVRGFATGSINLKRIPRLLPREIATGTLIGSTFGILCGTITALLASAMNAGPMLGLVVGVSMSCGTTIAATLGVIVPATCKKIGIDPAVSAGPFIATLLDSTALLLYLGIATSMMKYLQL